MRNVLAVLLAALAAIAGASAWGGSVADRTLTQPETVQSTLGPLIDDAGVRSMLATRVQAQVVSRLPGGVIPKNAKTVVEGVIKKATDAVLDDPGVKQAWNESLDESRKLYVTRVRDEGGSAGRIEVVLDPLATLAASHVSEAIKGLGIPVKAPGNVSWKLDQNISDISPLASLTVPGLQLVVTQSKHWAWYGVAGGVLMLLALLAARRRAVPVVTAGVIGGTAGLVGLWAAGLVKNIAGAASNPVMTAAAGSVAEVIRATSVPIAVAGAAVLVLGIVMLIIGAARNRRASVDLSA